MTTFGNMNLKLQAVNHKEDPKFVEKTYRKGNLVEKCRLKIANRRPFLSYYPVENSAPIYRKRSEDKKITLNVIEASAVFACNLHNYL